MRSTATRTLRLCTRGGGNNHRHRHRNHFETNTSLHERCLSTISAPTTSHTDSEESVQCSQKCKFSHISSQVVLSTSHSSSSVGSLLQQNQLIDQVGSRYYSTTSYNERPALVLGLASVAATAKAGQYAFRAYEQWKESQPPPPTEEELKAKAAEDEAKANDNKTNGKDESTSQKTDEKKDGKRKNFFSQYFNIDVGSKYYEGGFEEKMTKREAALILGVRESSTEKRIKEAHRKLLILNHPDTGGSTFLSGKINEAKELLLKGRARV